MSSSPGTGMLHYIDSVMSKKLRTVANCRDAVEEIVALASQKKKLPSTAVKQLSLKMF